MLQLANVDEKENQINKLICSMEQGVQFSKLKKRGGGGAEFSHKKGWVGCSEKEYQ